MSRIRNSIELCSFPPADVHGGQYAAIQSRGLVATTQVEAVGPHARRRIATRQDGTNSPRLALRLACFLYASNTGRTRRRAHSIAHSTPAPHRRYPAVASRKRRRVATPVRFPFRIGRSVCWPTMTPADVILMWSHYFPTVISLCPRCNHFGFQLFSMLRMHTYHAHATCRPWSLRTNATPCYVPSILCTQECQAYATYRPRICHRTGNAFIQSAISAWSHFGAVCTAGARGRPILGGWVTDWTLYPERER
jgi:hypothetical protein